MILQVPPEDVDSEQKSVEFNDKVVESGGTGVECELIDVKSANERVENLSISNQICINFPCFV